MAAAAAPRRRLTTRERRGVVRHRDGSVPSEAGHFFLSDSDIDGDGREWGAWVSASATHSAIGRRGREGEWAASTSVSYMWRTTGHSERREFAKNWSTNKVMRRFWKEMARPAGLEPATLGLEGRSRTERITADLGKTGSAFLVNGRSWSFRVPFTGKVCTKLHRATPGHPAVIQILLPGGRRVRDVLPQELPHQIGDHTPVFL